LNQIVRMIRHEDLGDLLGLYRQLHEDDPDLRDDPRLGKHWDDILKDPNVIHLAVEVDGKIVSSCCLAIIKNFTRDMRPYGIIENVITHQAYRKHGYGSMVLQKAVDIARERECYKVMLLTGHRDEETLRFYEQAGFDRGKKIGFIINF
jgi:ribosomal protein S18 acetylase RimI-like enzyme